MKETKQEKARREVKEQLWRFGLRASDVSKYADYDLFVQEKFKMKVVVSSELREVVMFGCDVMAIIVGNKRSNKLYSFGKKMDKGGIQRFNDWKRLSKIFKK